MLASKHSCTRHISAHRPLDISTTVATLQAPVLSGSPFSPCQTFRRHLDHCDGMRIVYRRNSSLRDQLPHFIDLHCKSTAGDIVGGILLEIIPAVREFCANFVQGRRFDATNNFLNHVSSLASGKNIMFQLQFNAATAGDFMVLDKPLKCFNVFMYPILTCHSGSPGQMYNGGHAASDLPENFTFMTLPDFPPTAGHWSRGEDEVTAEIGSLTAKSLTARNIDLAAAEAALAVPVATDFANRKRRIETTNWSPFKHGPTPTPFPTAE